MNKFLDENVAGWKGTLKPMKKKGGTRTKKASAFLPKSKTADPGRKTFTRKQLRDLRDENNVQWIRVVRRFP